MEKVGVTLQIFLNTKHFTLKIRPRTLQARAHSFACIKLKLLLSEITINTPLNNIPEHSKRDAEKLTISVTLYESRKINYLSGWSSFHMTFVTATLGGNLFNSARSIFLFISKRITTISRDGRAKIMGTLDICILHWPSQKLFFRTLLLLFTMYS